MTSKLPIHNHIIGPDTPLRLDRAVELAFPAGGMTVSGLRREASKGNLRLKKLLATSSLPYEQLTR